MQRHSKSERAYALAATVAHDLNEELTVILNSVAHTVDSLDPEHPAFPHMAELLASVQRCAWRSSKLLNFCARRGHLSGRSGRLSLEEESPSR